MRVNTMNYERNYGQSIVEFWSKSGQLSDMFIQDLLAEFRITTTCFSSMSTITQTQIASTHLLHKQHRSPRFTNSIVPLASQIASFPRLQSEDVTKIAVHKSLSWVYILICYNRQMGGMSGNKRERYVLTFSHVVIPQNKGTMSPLLLLVLS